MDKPKQTSWQNVAPWYEKLVGEDGHYYHQHVVLPGVLRLLDLQPEDSLADIGCGQGVLSRAIPKISKYIGLDIAPVLISIARRETRNAAYTFRVSDVTKPLPITDTTFSHAAIVLALQNMSRPDIAIINTAKYVRPGGKIVIVLNHPAFRIPRQSGWGVEPNTKQQYRWENRYISPIKIPITMNPGQQESKVTWSFHFALQDYVRMLAEAGFVITNLEEWVSDKTSEGKAARMENRARKEFPLFLVLVGERRA